MIAAEVYVATAEEPTLEELDREIEEKVMQTFVPPEADFSYSKELTSENYPLCGEVFARVNLLAAVPEESKGEEEVPPEERKYEDSLEEDE